MDGRTKAPEEPKANSANGWDPHSIFEINQQAFQSWARGMSALTEHMGQFMQARWREDIGTWNKLTACRDPSQWLECQREYVEKSASDYLTESGKLACLALDLASDGFSALRPAVRETVPPREMAAA